MNQSMIEKKLHSVQRISELLFYLFAAECVFGGSGRWLTFGSVSIRILLFMFCFVATLPYVLLKWRVVFRNPFIIITLVFSIAVLISLSIGVANNNSLSFIWADVSSFLMLALLPGMLAVIDENKKLLQLLDVIFFASLFVAVSTLVFHFWLAWMNDAGVNFCNNWINEKNLGGFALLETHLNRVYFRSQIFLQFSILYGAWKIGASKSLPQQFLLYVCEGVILFAIIVSYTRGFWLGLAFSALVILILEWKHWRQLFRTAGIVISIAVLIAGCSTVCYRQPYVFVEIVNRFDSNLIVLSADTESLHEDNRTEVNSTGQDGTNLVHRNEEIDIVAKANENAVNLRKDSLVAMKHKIVLHPLIGSGLGTNLDGVRDDGKTEYMYLDLIMKMGLSGLAIFLVEYLLSSVFHIFGRLKRFKDKIEWNSEFVRNSFLVAGFLGVALTSAFNPFLTTPMGILMLGTVNLAVCNLQKAD